jgi:hypothetical protein
MLKIKSEKVARFGNRLRISEESIDEYEWIINHLATEIKCDSLHIYGLNDSKKNRMLLEKLFKAHGVEVQFS